jgi:hypothetical protein
MKEARFNLRCMMWSVILGEWWALRFHWRRLKRTLRGGGR